MSATTKTKINNLDAMDIAGIIMYLAHRVWKRYIVPNAVPIWSSIAAAEATYILVKGIF